MDFFLWDLKPNVFWTWIFVIDIVFQFITARQRSCGKVMFSQVSVILFTGGVWCHLLYGPIFFPEGYDATSCLVPCSFQRGAWRHILSGPMFLPGGVSCSPPYGGREGGTHPTGMQSCSLIFWYFFYVFLDLGSREKKFSTGVSAGSVNINFCISICM